MSVAGAGTSTSAHLSLINGRQRVDLLLITIGAKRTPPFTARRYSLCTARQPQNVP